MICALLGKLIDVFSRIRIRCLRSYKTSLVNTVTETSFVGGECGIRNPENIFLGANSYINGGMIYASPEAKIIIGENCMISYNVHLRVDMHGHESGCFPMIAQQHTHSDIVIGDNVWVGYGAQIMPGVTIGSNVIVGAGAVVTKDVPSNAVVGGVPARVIKER